MAKTIIYIKTWSCDGCGYRQDFDPVNIPIHFPKVPAGKCPACWTGKNKSRTNVDMDLTLETVKSKRTKITIMDNAELETKEVMEGKTKRKLTKAEKDVLKKQIDDDIIKFKKIEDNS